MDLKNFETTTTYAIEAVYRDYWFMLPEKYRLLEKTQRNDHRAYLTEELENPQPGRKPKVKQTTPLSYKDVENKEFLKEDEYERYCEILNDREQYFDLQPFYDPQLDFENRLHYKLTNVNYPDRKNPWFIITWNFGQGIKESSVSNRRFQSASVTTQTGEEVTFDFIETELDLTLCFTSNTLQGLVELQENLRVGRREKAVVNTRKHTILGELPISLKTISSSINKLERSKSTLCTLMLNLTLDYMIIGNVQSASGLGIIKEIHLEIDRPHGEGPDEHEVLSRDIITSDEEEEDEET